MGVLRSQPVALTLPNLPYATIAGMTVLLTLLIAAAPPGEIAFVRGDVQAHQKVCVVTLATGDITEVGPGHYDGPPAWSPNGEWLAFASRRDAGMGIYVVRRDGAEGRYLPTMESWNRDPLWSPDGQAIAYTAGDGLNTRIIVFDLESATESVWGGEGPPLANPAWLPSRKVLAALLATVNTLSEGADAPSAIAEDVYGMIAVGMISEARIADTEDDENQAPVEAPQLTGLTTDLYIVTPTRSIPLPAAAMPSSRGRYFEWGPVPDMRGKGIAFESNDGGDREIFNTTAKRGGYDLSNDPAADWNPVWGPDGKWIAFESVRLGPRAIYRVHRDTYRAFTVAGFGTGDAWSPTWSFDGDWIAFVSNHEGPTLLYAVELKSETMVSFSKTASAYAPAWRPDP